MPSSFWLYSTEESFVFPASWGLHGLHLHATLMLHGIFFAPQGRGIMPPAGGKTTPPIFFPEKENGRRPSKRKAFPIASEQLEELQCLPIALPIARRCRVSIAIRFDLLLLSAAALLIL